MANFALPAHYRTWQFQVNVAIAAQASTLLTNALMVRSIKDALLGTGAWTDAANGAVASSGNWTVVSCCNGAGGAGSFGNNDATDRWNANTDLIWAAAGSNHSWIVLEQTGITGGPLYLYLDLNNTTGSWRLQAGWSTTLYTNGTATAAPSGANLALAGSVAVPYPTATAYAWGGSQTNVGSTIHVMKSADGKASRVIVCRNGWATGLWILDELENASAAWTAPAICNVGGGDSTGAPASDTSLVQNIFANAGNQVGLASINGNPALTLMHHEYFGGSSLVTVPTVINDMDNAWPMYRMGVYVRPNQAYANTDVTPLVNCRGYSGQIRDLWWVQSQLGEGDTMPAAATQNFVILGDTCHPWNTTVIDRNGGAAGAAVDGYEVPLVPQYEIVEPAMDFSSVLPAIASIVGAAQVYYIMQANDSVTGVRYDWTVPSTPDRAGLGYPGPNAPINITVAGVNFGSGSSVFTPLQYADCGLWLRAGVGVTQASSLVSQWLDYSPSALIFTAAGGARPTYTPTGMNGMPSIQGDGATDMMVSTAPLDLSAATGLTLFYVAKDTAAAGQVAIENDVSQPTNFTSVPNNGGAGNLNLSVTGAGGTRNNNFNGAGSDLVAPAVVCYVLDSTLTGTGQSVCYVNGTPIVRVGGAGVDCGAGYGNSLVYLFARLGVVAPWAGEFGEIILYKRALTTTERNVVTTNLRNAYGL